MLFLPTPIVMHKCNNKKSLIYVNYGDTYGCNNSMMQSTRFFIKIWVTEFTSVQCRQSLMVSLFKHVHTMYSVVQINFPLFVLKLCSFLQ